MIARDVMTATPFTVKETDTVRFAAQLMLKHDMGFLPVLADTTTPRLAGVVTDRDITVRCVAGGMPLDSFVAAVMTKPPLATVTPDASMDEVAQMMERARVRRLPVLGARDEVLGVITLGDVVRALGHREPATVEEILERVVEAAHAVG